MKNRSNEWHKKKRQEELADDPDAIECLICGKKYIQVCTHVVQAHDMTAREYKDKFGLWTDGIIRGEYRKRKSKSPLENGTWENLKKGKKNRIKKGEGLRYKRGYKKKFTKKVLGIK